MSRYGAQPEDFMQLPGEKTSKQRISVFFAAGNASTSEALYQYLRRSGRFELVGNTDAASDICWMIAAKQPDVVIFGLPFPAVRIGEVIAQIRESQPHCGIVVLADRSDRMEILSALAAGARGCLLRDSEPAQVRMAITSVHNGGIWLHPGVNDLFRQVVADGSSITISHELDISIQRAECDQSGRTTVELPPSEEEEIGVSGLLARHYCPLPIPWHQRRQFVTVSHWLLVAVFVVVVLFSIRPLVHSIINSVSLSNDRQQPVTSSVAPTAPIPGMAYTLFELQCRTWHRYRGTPAFQLADSAR